MVPRLRAPAVAEVGGVPPELLDGADLVWQSKGATVAWLRRQGLPPSGRQLEWGPLNRHQISAFKWAADAGLMKPPLSNGYVGPDYERMRELGLPAAGGGKYALERMASLGVEIEG